MNYYKTDTGRWGTNETRSFYDLVLSEKIVFCADSIAPEPGDIVAITAGFTVKALAVVRSRPYPITESSSNGLKDKVAEYNIPYEDWNTIADVMIQELDEKDYFTFKSRTGISSIQKPDVINTINNLLNRIELEWKYTMNMISDMICKVGNLVLTGAPGCGKTFLAKKIALSLADDDSSRIGFCQFHPSFDYTDFIEGLRPVNQNGQISFQRKDGVFKSFCKRALENPSAKHVFLIDEINRGDISKIFGELFFSIDNGYRGKNGRVSTQYQNLIDDDDVFAEGFYVPENVYIIGTMNDIDRSVESMDFAIRRRFCWYEVKAMDTADSILASLDPAIAEKAKARMANMNRAIEETEGLSSAYHIGAAYFLNLKTSCENDFGQLWDYHLKPLVSEYLRGQRNSDESLARIKEAFKNEIIADLP